MPNEKLPRHVGIIMDGNGRWAKERSLKREEGHSKGAESFREIIRIGRRVGLEALTLFAFSNQNWSRPVREVSHLISLMHHFLTRERGEILDHDVRLVSVGAIERMPRLVTQPLTSLQEESANNKGMTVCIALSYGGREAIAEAAKKIAQAAVRGEIDPQDVDPELFDRYMPSNTLLPPLDLLIRTGGEHRVSNFFLWELAYAELYFSPVMWPDFGEDEMRLALATYASRERRYGMTSDQVARDAGRSSLLSKFKSA
jgi:undecaprenyl diphosphate synthase